MPAVNRFAFIIAGCALILIGIGMLRFLMDLKAWVNTPIVFDEPDHKTAVIRPGDTIWHIARREYGGAETGKWVWEICRLNPGLDPGRLQVGQEVRLP